tara:strand:+ start:250 stop:636 length:387 start_codon:yes stop_codon:yes gene_type:complete
MEWYLKAMKQYTTFSGRARRKEYWMFVLFYSLFLIIAMILDNVAGLCFETEFMGQTISAGYGWLYLLVGAIHFIPALSVVVRRLHDIGKSGWMYLVVFIPIIGFIWILVLLVKDGEAGDNEYGANPKA